MPSTAAKLPLPSLAWRLSILSLLGYAYLITALRSVREPIGYAQIHWLLDYRFGFFKRALPGSILNALGVHDSLMTSFTVIYTLSIIFFALMTALLLGILWRFVAQQNYAMPSIFLALLLATSPFTVYTALLMGYYDHILQAATIMMVFLILQKRLLPVVLLQLPLIFIHEMYLLMGFPVVLFTLWLTMRDEQRGLDWRGWAIVLVPPLSFVMVFAAMDFTSTPEMQLAGWSPIIERYTFIPQEDRESGPGILIWGFSNYLADQVGGVPYRITQFPLGVMFTVLITLHVIWQSTTKRYRVPLQVGVALVTIMPLSMFLIAFDKDRIWAYSIFHIMLLLWMLSERGVIRLEKTLDLTLLYLIGFLIHFRSMPELLDGTLDRFAEDGALLFSVYSPLIISLFYFKETRNLITNIFMGTRRPTAKSKILTGD